MSSNDRIVRKKSSEKIRFNPSMPALGIVKVNSDPSKMGRLKVWIVGSTTPENDPSGWIWVSYCSPFAGATPMSQIGRNTQSYDDTQKSFGMWVPSPEIGTEVLVFFVNGILKKGYWLGCTYQESMNYMVPGLSAGSSFQSNNSEFIDAAEGKQPLLPVSEYNKYRRQVENESKDLLERSSRPYYEPLANGLSKQGLISDSLRGAGTSSSRRESPSKVFGYLSPGGNQIILDDGEGSELIRLRTKSGAQILISETFGHVYMITKDGNTWVELSNDGNIDIYGSQNISIRSEGDINLRSDRNINMEAKGQLNLKSTHGGLNFNSEQSSMRFYSDLGFNFTSSSGTIDFYSKGTIRFSSEGFFSIITEEEYNVFSNGGSNSPLPPYPALVGNKIQSNTIVDKSFNGVKFSDRNLETILSRVPSHEPFGQHKDVEISQPRNNQVSVGDSNNIRKGSVSSVSSAPLPLVGKPKKGMQEGFYTPVNYTPAGEPTYKYLGGTSELVPVNQLSTSESGKEFIKAKEGFAPRSYPDGAGRSIGYGHFIEKGEFFAEPITKNFAEQLFEKDIKKYEDAVRRNTKVKLTQSQFDSLVSFTYNVGIGAYAKSTLLKKLNNEEYSAVPSEMVRWVFETKKGKKVVNSGLLSRRKAEAEIFSRPPSTIV